MSKKHFILRHMYKEMTKPKIQKYKHTEFCFKLKLWLIIYNSKNALSSK